MADLGPIRLAERRKVPSPPGYLQADGRRLWREVLNVYHLTAPQQLHQLEIAAAQADVLADCRAAIAQDGRFPVGRWGPRVHPAVLVGEKAGRLMLAAFRALELDYADVQRWGAQL